MNARDNPPHDGERVKHALAVLDISQKQFGATMGWDKSKVSRMLDQASWRTDELHAAQKALKTDLFAAHQQINGNATTVFVPVELPPDSPVLSDLHQALRTKLPLKRKEED